MKKDEVDKKLQNAKKTLKDFGYEFDVSAEDVMAYLNADTYDETLSAHEILNNHLLVIHELLEISEIKKWVRKSQRI